jgi:superfamily II DNA/RNA helicase
LAPGVQPGQPTNRQAVRGLPEKAQLNGLPGAHLSSAHRFTLQLLQRELGSSPWAVEPTLRHMAGQAAEPARRQRLLVLADQAAGLTTWSKAETLTKLLEPLVKGSQGRDRKALIFTHFQRTLEKLAERLQALDIPFEVYHGGLSYR